MKWWLFLTVTIMLSLPAAWANTCDQLADKLRYCEEYECETVYDDESQYPIKHMIYGFQPDGKCLHVQTLPKGALVRCLYDLNGRMALAGQIQAGAGAPTDGILQFEKDYLKTVFAEQCQPMRMVDEQGNPFDPMKEMADE